MFDDVARWIGWRPAVLVAAILMASSLEAQLDPETQAEKKVFNPADVTAAASHIEIVPEYNNGDEVSAPLLRLIYDIDWAEGKYSITTELPYGQVDFDDGKTETGLGDIRLRHFQRVHQAKNPEASIQNMVFSLDAFLPTGDSDKGLGTGTFLLAKG